MPAPKKSVVGYIAKKIAKKAVAKPKPRSVNNVRISPDKTTGRIKGTKGMEQVVQERMRMNANPTKAAAKANARGLKAANKSLSKGNKKLVTQIEQQTGYIAMDRRPTPPTVAAALKKGPKGNFIAEAKKIAMQEARKNSPAKKISPAQKALNKKLKKSK